MTDEVMDLGNGYSARWVGWSPDREIPANAERFAGIPDLECACLIITCPHGEGAIHPKLPPPHDNLFGDVTWDVESWDPLTLSPSILRHECGCHGYIRNGQWENC